MKPVDRSAEGGFALVLTLVVIVILSLMTEIMTRWISTALDSALANREQVDATREITEAAAVSMYLLATRPLSFRGIEVSTAAQPSATNAPQKLGSFEPAQDYIRLDDHPYRLGDAVLRLQDARGLINLNFGSSDDLFTVLGIFGVAVEDRGPLIAKLQDYIDADSLTRLNGAEAPEYADAGREPPANAPLRTPWEVRRILDWDKVEDVVREDSGWERMTSTALFTGFNVNTAPRTLLSLMPWMTEEAVDDVVRWRRDYPITSAREFGDLTGIPMPARPSQFLSFPADNLVITLSATHAPLDRRVALHLTPQSRDRPWAIDYDVEIPRRDLDAGRTNPDALPLPALLSPVP